MSKQKQTIHSGIILDLLAQKHAKDLFVPECKDGPTWTANHFRMDAWVLRRSWAHPCTTGYEIKVSRSDFVGDQKWPAYLAYCNEFYFACPTGLISPDELPKEVGLLWTTPNGGRLYLKRKAVYRPVQIPDEVYRYILMSRVDVKRYSWDTDNRVYWRRWLAQEKVDGLLGRSVSNKLRKLVSQEIDEVKKKQLVLEKQMENYEDIRRILKSMGFNEDTYVYSYHVQRKLQEIKDVVPEDLSRATNEAWHALNRLKDKLQELEKAKETTDA